MDELIVILYHCCIMIATMQLYMLCVILVFGCIRSPAAAIMASCSETVTAVLHICAHDWQGVECLWNTNTTCIEGLQPAWKICKCHDAQRALCQQLQARQPPASATFPACRAKPLQQQQQQVCHSPQQLRKAAPPTIKMPPCATG